MPPGSRHSTQCFPRHLDYSPREPAKELRNALENNPTVALQPSRGPSTERLVLIPGRMLDRAFAEPAW